MKQQSLSDIKYSNRKKKTKREEFLDSMDQIIPWEHWIDLIKVHYPSGKRGRPTRGIETMLRMYLMQNWFNLSDATILLKFRHLLEKHKIGEQIFADVKARLESAGLLWDLRNA